MPVLLSDVSIWNMILIIIRNSNILSNQLKILIIETDKDKLIGNRIITIS